MRTTYMIRFFICTSVFFALLAHPRPASACSCIMQGPPADEFAQSDAVFTGTVIKTDDNYSLLFSILDKILGRIGMQSYSFYRNDKYWGRSIFFTVMDSWKGVTETIVEADTDYGGGDCGYAFVIGNDYLVYAYHAYGQPGNYLVTSICSRNSELSFATEDLTYLNTLPTLPLNPSLGLIGLLIGRIAPILIFIVIAIAIFLYAYQRRRARRLKTE